MKKLLWLTLFALPFLSLVRPQQPPATDLSTADSVNGVYIPRNFGECMSQLDDILPDSSKLQLKSTVNAISQHFGLGLFIRNNWLKPNSRLYLYLKEKGGMEPDGMSRQIVELYIEHLNSRDQRQQWLDTPESTLFPVILVNGEKVGYEFLHDFANPDNIETLDITKGADSVSTSKYGMQAYYNGVIIVTTK